ncbi:hypothetical protein NE237_008665 [Protea cynaroides]|uniref:CCT domain-containing protein n=1 Tax=Protea cynaroides TaxID=273540 RepID=A0A9Q0KW88_9MAGN|nr:hypothetical protein NE237_008665 [Protea cynaroides]
MYEFGDLFNLSCSSDFIGRPPEITNTSSLPDLFPATVPSPEYDSVREVLAALRSDIGSSSLPSYSNYYPPRPNLIQRCMSSQSLSNGHNPIFLSSPDDSALENFDFDDGPMRKVFSTGDLQTINLAQQQYGHHHLHRSDSPISHESCSLEGTKKVRCYSAQERKERIEKYRSKRSRRNFNKKIKYACRKTLADSRPRIRGRFARNEEIGESIQTDQWSQIGGEEDEEEDDVWTSFLGTLSTNFIP